MKNTILILSLLAATSVYANPLKTVMGKVRVFSGGDDASSIEVMHLSGNVAKHLYESLKPVEEAKDANHGNRMGVHYECTKNVKIYTCELFYSPEDGRFVN